MRKSSAILGALAIVAAGFVAFEAVRWHLPDRNHEPPGEPGLAPAPHWFAETALRDGFEFLHHAGPLREDYFFPQIMGSGCALFDFDRDGDLDLYLIDGSPGDSRNADQSVGGTHAGNRLFRNEGRGTFTDVSAGSGLDVRGIGMGVAAGDVNNDGFPDLYVTSFGPDRLFLNRCDGTFIDVTAPAGLDNARWGTSASFVDYDRDGWLDLVVVNYVDYHASQRCVEPNGRPDYCNPKLFPGTPARLFHNESGRADLARDLAADGEPTIKASAGGVPAGEPARAVRFRDVSLESRIGLTPGPGLGVVCADFNGDRWPDIFVANDGAANHLWINRRDGTFEEQAVSFGLAFDNLGRPQANMGIALGDIDGDGGLDLLVTHLGGEGSALYRGRGTESFEESAARAGVRQASFPSTGFGAAFLDIDHDGRLDLAVVNGRVKRRDGAVSPKFLPSGEPASRAEFWMAYSERNLLFQGAEGGTFRERHAPDEPFTRDAAVWRGLATGDIDNDGDLDLLVTSVAGAARLFRNVAEKQGHWLSVRAVEPRCGGRDALGASVAVVAGGRRRVRLISAGGSYLSASDPRAHFGSGEAAAIDRIEVIWPDGSGEVFEGGAADRFVTVEHGRGRAANE